MIDVIGKYNTAHVMIDSFDESTYKQILTFVNHPAFSGSNIAIMPDCLHPDTEILTPRGFIKIADLNKNDLIAAFLPENGTYTFEKPSAIIVRPLRVNERMYALQSNRLGNLSVQTENHRNAYLPSMGIKCKDLPEAIPVKDMVLTASYTLTTESIPDAVIRLVAWIVGDGNIHGNNNKKKKSYRIRFGLKKQRKINRILELCSCLGIDPKITITTEQTTIELNTEDSKRFIDITGHEKVFPIKWVTLLSSRQKELLLKEAICVDGDYEAYRNNRGFRLNSSRIEDIEFFSALSVDIGTSIIKRRVRKTPFTKNGSSAMYYLSITRKDRLHYTKSGIHNSLIKKVPYTENINNVVCIACSTGFFVYRFKGRTGITGNCHAGAGCVIGFTMPLNEYVIPNVIGVDIGCGMLMGVFDVDASGVDLHALDQFIHESIPAGFSINNVRTSIGAELQQSISQTCAEIGIDDDRALKSIGTLGGGNHFIEAGKNSNGQLCITIHSGSRNFGKCVADFYQRKAAEHLDPTIASMPGGSFRKLEPLRVDSAEGKAYLKAVDVAQDYASANRAAMLLKLSQALGHAPSNIIESVHNFIGDDDIIRKGATPARKDEMVIIPFNMRDGIALCRGKGSAAYNYSAPHGAGRILSRSKAKETLSVDVFQQQMSDAGVFTTTANRSTLDEAPDAYKSMDVIVDNIKDTVDVIELIKPLYNFKSGGD